MSNWIEFDKQWPEDGQRIWVRVSEDIALRLTAIVKNGTLALEGNGHRFTAKQWMSDDAAEKKEAA